MNAESQSYSHKDYNSGIPRVFILINKGVLFVDILVASEKQRFDIHTMLFRELDDRNVVLLSYCSCN